MKNFFNAIGMADMEKVHSAMIAWILDDENDKNKPGNSTSDVKTSNFTTLSITERSKLLCKMFGVTPEGRFDSIRTTLEWNDIDILIETKMNGKTEAWVIENKLKSQEHKSRDKDDNEIWQTEKYKNLIDNKFGKNNSHYILLSLGGDEAKTNGWTSLTYKRLSDLLQKYPENSIIDEYVKAITLMTNELDKFLSETTDYSKYPNVFIKLKKSEKPGAQLEEEEKYIVENGLETIFQKQLLSKLKIKLNLDDANETFYIEEWNGSATFGFIPFKDWGEIDESLKLQVEFQNGTFKVVLISSDVQKYREADKDDMSKIYNKRKDVFVKAEKKPWKFQPSKNDAKPRVSLTKRWGGNKKWYTQLDKFNDKYNEAVQKAIEIYNIIK